MRLRTYTRGQVLLLHEKHYRSYTKETIVRTQERKYALQHNATYCNILQHTAAHCSTRKRLPSTHEKDDCSYTRERLRAATHCNTLQHTATHERDYCSYSGKSLHHIKPTKRNYALQHTATYCNTLQHTATYCNIQQHTATHCNTQQHTAIRHLAYQMHDDSTPQHAATHCNTLQHTATHCNTLQHTASHCSMLRYTATHCNTLQHTATHCITLHHTATHCNILQYVDFREVHDSFQHFQITIC